MAQVAVRLSGVRAGGGWSEKGFLQATSIVFGDRV